MTKRINEEENFHHRTCTDTKIIIMVCKKCTTNRNYSEVNEKETKKNKKMYIEIVGIAEA